MSKNRRKKKSGNQRENLASTLNLIAAFLNLVTVILIALEKLLEQRAGGAIPSLLNSNTKNAQCQLHGYSYHYFVRG